MDKANTLELTKFILRSIKLIKSRFITINSYNDFLSDDDGLMRLDAISMRLQAIGEALKNINKREDKFLLKIADKKYWSNIIKTREILSHHYINIDSEIVYFLCDEKLDELERNIIKLEKIIRDL